MPGRDVTNQAGIAVINSAAAAELTVTLKLNLSYFKRRETAHKFLIWIGFISINTKRVGEIAVRPYLAHHPGTFYDIYEIDLDSL